MDAKDVLLKLRKDRGYSQDELAEKVYVTRQAVSRWETGETVPNTETLKLLSAVYDVSINTLLGSPRELRCQSCGMPLGDAVMSREADGSYNESWCKWCWSEGHFVSDCTMDEMIEQCLPHMTGWEPDTARAFMRENFPTLERWKA
jgi:transcriptional regulator with XRE-family HTH domain